VTLLLFGGLFGNQQLQAPFSLMVMLEIIPMHGGNQSLILRFTCTFSFVDIVAFTLNDDIYCCESISVKLSDFVYCLNLCFNFCISAFDVF